MLNLASACLSSVFKHSTFAKDFQPSVSDWQIRFQEGKTATNSIQRSKSKFSMVGFGEDLLKAGKPLIR